MSRENVEIVREMNRAFNRHEDRWLDFYGSDVEYVMPPEWPEDRVYRGRESLRKLLFALREIFVGQEWRLERVIDVDDDCVVVLASVHASVQGGQLGQRAAAVHYLQGGQIVRQLTYFSWEEALEAVGLAG
jgi:ketosteroid isomerase-like protein